MTEWTISIDRSILFSCLNSFEFIYGTKYTHKHTNRLYALSFHGWCVCGSKLFSSFFFVLFWLFRQIRRNKKKMFCVFFGLGFLFSWLFQLWMLLVEWREWQKTKWKKKCLKCSWWDGWMIFIIIIMMTTSSFFCRFWIDNLLLLMLLLSSVIERFLFFSFLNRRKLTETTKWKWKMSSNKYDNNIIDIDREREREREAGIVEIVDQQYGSN